MKRILKRKKICFTGLAIFVLFVISGALLYKDTSAAKSNGLTPEQIYRIHSDYIESTYGPGTGFTITSYGDSGIGSITHETGEATWDVTGNEK